jgi:hypothetical protein
MNTKLFVGNLSYNTTKTTTTPSRRMAVVSELMVAARALEDWP